MELTNIKQSWTTISADTDANGARSAARIKREGNTVYNAQLNTKIKVKKIARIEDNIYRVVMERQ